MHNVLVAGSGKVGSLISSMLVSSGRYFVIQVDKSSQAKLLMENKYYKFFEADIADEKVVANFIREFSIGSVISCLPYFCSITVANLAAKYHLDYFDLTEDTEVLEHVKQLSQTHKNVFAPGCGLAPGFIDTAAYSMASKFDEIETVKLRAGSLPVNASNVLQYALTWSTDGLINEYGNTCYGIVKGEKTALQPLEGLEMVEIDGTSYEAFNTSGGIGTLVDAFYGKVKTLNYKTLRYPGHRDKIKFLMQDLKLNDDRETLKKIFERSMPGTNNDVMIVYISVTGKKDGRYLEENYLNKIYAQNMLGRHYSAIQVTTASGMCSVFDIVQTNRKKYSGLLGHQDIRLEDILDNEFGHIFREESVE